MPKIRFALAQINPIVGDLSGNITLLKDAVQLSVDKGANLVCFGEMALTGYPIEDLANRPDFLEQANSALAEFRAWLGHYYPSTVIVVGAPTQASSAGSWAKAYNSAIAIQGETILGVYHKHHLPNYSVFDEYRIFQSGDKPLFLEVNGVRVALAICEDIWQAGGPVSQIADGAADLLLVLNGSPFERGKPHSRIELAKAVAARENVAVAYVNLVGGQDDLVFDGDSFVVNCSGALVGRMPQFETEISLFDFKSKFELTSLSAPVSAQDEPWQIWNALKLGLRDYVVKNGFQSVTLGLSGGIDSAVCAALAVDSIGAANVHGVLMPSKYSSSHSLIDAEDLTTRLGISSEVEPIQPTVDLLADQLKLSGLALENIQARIRGAILMARSNSHGHLVITTGNKTEIAVGYSTIYGDSVGGFAPLKDVEKTLVWKLARWRNKQARLLGQVEPIPANSIEKAPSAELREGQTDQDSLPPYEVLDRLLEGYLEHRQSESELVAAGFELETVQRIIRLVDSAEWKRRQGAIGTKISGMAFGRDRRLPITNRYR